MKNLFHRKPTLFVLALAAAGLLIAVAQTTIVPVTQTLTKTVASADTPEQLTTNEIWGHTIVFLGMKATRTNNTGTVYIQCTSSNSGAGIPLQPGGTVSITVTYPPIRGVCATNFWIDVDTAGDGVVSWVIE